MATSQRKKSTQSCGSACFGSPSFVKNKKKKFDYNNDKCLHGLDGVMLQSGTQWNPVDENKDDEKNIGAQEDVKLIMNTMTSMAEELKGVSKEFVQPQLLDRRLQRQSKSSALGPGDSRFLKSSFSN
ncbi:hypothetical protein PIB30_026450 [Stylosanthes scabra]|uniref:Uncharacterized protein n=1 Tax=Stylosanthes scabra TaxID=79078 RepID=A0ABU6VA76_9FABA|nr:hypothetical protein [Stylosanthes scabra]